MDTMHAIYHRRAVRSYTSAPVASQTLQTLLDAAVQAPSAMNCQPWAFVVVEDQARLDRFSAEAKRFVLAGMTPGSPLERLRESLEDPGFHLFYHAPALIVICARPGFGWAETDCALAAQNLMLAACAAGLGSCWIGLAQGWLNQPEGKRELGIPDDHRVVAPIIVGYPQAETPPVARKAPEVLAWR
jgi:nitroreductase